MVLVDLPGPLHLGGVTPRCRKVSQIGPVNTYFKPHFPGMCTCNSKTSTCVCYPKRTCACIVVDGLPFVTVSGLLNMYLVVSIHRLYAWYISYAYSIYSAARKRQKTPKMTPANNYAYQACDRVAGVLAQRWISRRGWCFSGFLTRHRGKQKVSSRRHGSSLLAVCSYKWSE